MCRKKNLSEEILELIPGTLEYRVIMIEIEKKKVPECPVITHFLGRVEQ